MDSSQVLELCWLAFDIRNSIRLHLLSYLFQCPFEHGSVTTLRYLYFSFNCYLQPQKSTEIEIKASQSSKNEATHFYFSNRYINGGTVKWYGWMITKTACSKILFFTWFQMVNWICFSVVNWMFYVEIMMDLIDWKSFIIWLYYAYSNMHPTILYK